MTAVSVVWTGTRNNDATMVSPPWYDIGGGKPVAETDVVFQGSASVSEKCAASVENGVGIVPNPAIDMSTTPKVVLFKVTITNVAALNVLGSTGGIIEIGSGGRRSAYDRYYVVGSDTYPPRGGWLVIPVDPNGGNYSARPGSAPTLTALNWFAWMGTCTASSKSENIMMDAFDYLEYGQGLQLQYGNGTDADGTFANFVAYDEGTIANRYGVVTSQDGVIYVTGTLTIGTANATVFTDSNQVVVFPDALFLESTGFFGIKFDLQASGTAITISDTVFRSDGDTTGTVDTRAVYLASGTTGTLTLSGCTFNTFYTVTFTSACSATSCIFINGGVVTAGGADLSGSQVLLSTVAADASALIWNTNADPDGELDDMTFSKGTNAHHALTLGTSSPVTVTLRGWTTSGFNASDGQNDSTFYLADRGSDTTWTINIIGGNGNFTYKKGRSGDTVNVVIDPVTATFRAQNADGGAAIQGVRVLVWAASGGSMKADAAITSITRSGSTATVTTTAAHTLASNEVVLIEDSENQPLEVEYCGPHTITVTGTDTFTFTVSGTPTTPATGTFTFSEVIINNAETDASGEVSDTRTYSADQPVVGAAVKGDVAPTYKTQTISTTLPAASDSTTTIPMTSDD